MNRERFAPITTGLPTHGAKTRLPRASSRRPLSSVEKKFSRGRKFFASSASLALIALSLASCSSRKMTTRVPVARIGSIEEGIASWYGDPYHGRRAANGEIFDMDKHTAAHQSLPFETWVRVKRDDTKKETEVRITDRGPFVKGRIIDLSRAAARDIDLVRDGVTKVRVTVIDPPRSYTRNRRFTIQVSSLRDKPRAEQLEKSLRAQYPKTEVRYRKPNPAGGHAESWRVLVGRESSIDDARKLLTKVLEKFPNAFIVPFDAE
ncbi:MAG: septal ring lytic transglycosylase RlpA family protein [Acidobacteria bacterium]|nr:septal ring lytic transglycosylase RlpA family protein [Acidobacteriota bacterium]